MVGLTVGLIKPGLVIRWGEKKTRGRVLLIFVPLTFLLMIMVGVTAPDFADKRADRVQQSAVEKQQKASADTGTKEEARKVEPPKPKDFSQMEVTQETVQPVVTSVINADKLSKIDIQPQKDGSFIVDVFYNPGTAVWDENHLVNLTARNGIRVVEKLMKNPKISKVWIWAETSMTDKYGKSSIEPVVNFSITRDIANKIEWKNFLSMVDSDYKAVFRVADKSFIHPGIAKNLK